MIATDDLEQAEARQVFLGVDRFQPRQGEHDAGGLAGLDHRTQALGGGVVDVDDPRRFQDRQADVGFSRGDGGQHVAFEHLGVEEGQRGLEGQHSHAGNRFALARGPGRPPHRAAG